VAEVVFGTRADLEQRITPQRLIQLFDDDNDGAVAGTDLDVLASVLSAANDVVFGALYNKGFGPEQIAELVADKQVLRAWTGIAAQLAGERKPEWLDSQGRGPYDAFGSRARAELKMIASGEQRSRVETTAGANLGLSGDVTDRVLQFAPDPRNPNDRYGPGGF
jgi:hypothetical protein